MNKKQKKNLRRILIALALVIAAAFLPPLPDAVRLAVYLVPYFVVGWDVLRKAVIGVRNRQPFDECFLMAVATVGAFLLGEYAEACAVMLFYQVGELFQSVAVGKSRRSIAALMDIRPDYANLCQPDGTVAQVDPEEVPVGARDPGAARRAGAPGWRGAGGHVGAEHRRPYRREPAPGCGARRQRDQRLRQYDRSAAGAHHQALWRIHRGEDLDLVEIPA